MVNLLFTSVGRRVELLRAFRQAYQSLKLDGRIIALDIDPLAPALRLADRPYIVPRLSAPDYLPMLVDICEREQISAIFPLIDPDIPVLARNREMIERTGARLGIVPEQAAHITADKWRTFEFFRSLGLPTPQSWLPGTFDASQADYPLFIKPRDGSAAKDTFRVRDARELAFFSEYITEPIVQEFLAGPEITSDVICDLDGQMLGVVSRRRIEVRWGEVAKGVTIYDEQIDAACRQIAAALPAIGPITVQCIVRDGVPYFTEINARMGGGLPLGVAAGANSPAWLLASLAGRAIETPQGRDSYKENIYLTRYDESFFLTEEERTRMLDGSGASESRRGLK